MTQPEFTARTVDYAASENWDEVFYELSLAYIRREDPEWFGLKSYGRAVQAFAVEQGWSAVLRAMADAMTVTVTQDSLPLEMV